MRHARQTMGNEMSNDKVRAAAKVLANEVDNFTVYLLHHRSQIMINEDLALAVANVYTALAEVEPKVEPVPECEYGAMGRHKWLRTADNNTDICIGCKRYRAVVPPTPPAKVGPVADSPVPMDLTQKCAVLPPGGMNTECPRCRNPHNACDFGAPKVDPVADSLADLRAELADAFANFDRSLDRSFAAMGMDKPKVVPVTSLARSAIERQVRTEMEPVTNAIERFRDGQQKPPIPAPELTLPVAEEVCFAESLRRIINQHSMENGSDTPDYVLAGFLSEALAVFNRTIEARTAWTASTTAKVEPVADSPASGVDEVAALQKIGLDVVVLDWQPVDVIAPIPAAPKVEPVADGPASATDVEKMLDRLRDSVKGCPIPVTTIQVALVREAADMIERLAAELAAMTAERNAAMAQIAETNTAFDAALLRAEADLVAMTAERDEAVRNCAAFGKANTVYRLEHELMSAERDAMQKSRDDYQAEVLRLNNQIDPTLEPLVWKDHNTAQLINRLRDVAVKYHAHAEQLRAQISALILPIAAIAKGAA